MAEFVWWPKSEGHRSVGFPLDFGDHQRVVHYDEGIPQQVVMNGETITRAAKDDALAYLRTIADDYEPTIQRGGLQGAMFGRMQDFLDGVIQAVEEGNLPYISRCTEPSRPGTGIYVVQPLYPGVSSPELCTLRLPFSLSEDDVEKMLRDIFNGGITRLIPGRIEVDGRSSWLAGYRAYEIPVDLVHLVKDARMIPFKPNHLSFLNES